MRVLLVEDEERLATTIARGLRREGMAVDVVLDGAAALDKTALNSYDVVVLDRNLPKVHGDDVCRELVRRESLARILMLTAAGAIKDRVIGLDLGADDYLPKPFALDELLARLRALLRRSIEQEPLDVLRFADLTFDLGSMDARRGGRRFELTTTEAHLLELFMRNPRQVLPRALIYERVWGYDFSHSSNALDVYVGYLRRKTEAESDARLIHTVRGTGYVLREP